MSRLDQLPLAKAKLGSDRDRDAPQSEICEILTPSVAMRPRISAREFAETFRQDEWEAAQEARQKRESDNFGVEVPD